MSMWYRIAPTATTATATCSITTSQGGGSMFNVVYSGAHQTTPIDAYNTASGNSNDSNVNVTTTVANCYVTGFSQNNGVAITTGSGMNSRISNGGGNIVLDSGELSTAQTFNWNSDMAGSQPWGVVAISLAPAASTANSGFFLFM